MRRNIHISVNYLSRPLKDFFKESQYFWANWLLAFHGGGSSFTKMEKIPSMKDLLSRSRQVQLPTEILERLQKSDISNLRKEHGYLE